MYIQPSGQKYRKNSLEEIQTLQQISEPVKKQFGVGNKTASFS